MLKTYIKAKGLWTAEGFNKKKNRKNKHVDTVMQSPAGMTKHVKNQFAVFSAVAD